MSKMLLNLMILLVANVTVINSQVLKEVRNEEISFSTDDIKTIKKNIFETYDGRKFELEQAKEEILDVIVEFVGLPYLMQQSGGLKKTVSESYYENVFNEFLSDITDNMHAFAKANGETIEEPIIEEKYHKIFFGVSVKVHRSMLSKINQLDYVKEVHFNKRVKLNTEDGVSIIKADKLRTKFNTKGEGIRVGVIDTGIDYMHPVFGSGYGEGFKVAGGYDFVDDDDDPMDMHNHGTHVAGIIAGKSDTFEGVAPRAILYAYRVLNENGEGNEADIIKAIEASLDPNDDGLMDDMLHVVNMSLGSDNGSPYDAMSIAVNNASSLGVTFCVAAGNGGSGLLWGTAKYFTVGSPGTAEAAITVGATDKTDLLADFSSRGPVFESYSIKPDVLAPGVSINSSVLNGKFESYNGTSMATPFVAGVSALLKSIHPDWSPLKIKSALMSTALDLNHKVIEQGSGRIVAENAADVNIFTYPQSISFGVDTIKTATWKEAKIVTIYNESNESKTFNLDIEGLFSGVEINSDKSTITINGNDSAKILLNLEVDNSIVDYPQIGSGMTYEGKINFRNEDEHFSLPWAFVKLLHIKFTFDVPYAFFDLLSEGRIISFEQVNWIDPYTALFTVETGKYDLICHFSDYEGNNATFLKTIEITDNNKSYHFNLNEADNKLSFMGKDFHGDYLGKHPLYSRKIIIELHNTVFIKKMNHVLHYIDWYSITGELPTETVGVYPDFEEEVTIEAFEWTADFTGSKEMYLHNYEVKRGLEGDYKFVNENPDYTSKKINLNFPNSADLNAFLWGVSEYHQNEQKEYYINDGFSINYRDPIETEWTGTLFMNESKNPNLKITPVIKTYDDKRLAQAGPNTLGYDFYMSTPPFVLKDGKISCYWANDITTYLLPSFGENHLSFGHTPFYPFVNWITNEASNVIDAEFFLRGQFNDYREKDTQLSEYTLYDDKDNVIISGNKKDFNAIKLEDKKYRFELVDKEYFIAGKSGLAVLRNTFNLSMSDAKPPTFTGLQLIDSSGHSISKIKRGNESYLRFSAADFNLSNKTRLESADTTFINFLSNMKALDSDSTKLFYKEIHEHEWIPLAAEKINENNLIGTIYKCNLSNLDVPDSALISIRIKVADLAGNTTEWTLEPGIEVGKYIDPTSVSGENDSPKIYSLNQNYPNPFNPSTRIKYQLSFEGYTQLKVYDILGQEVATLVNEIQKPGLYTINFDASKLVSGVYIYRITSGNFVSTKKMLLLR